MKIKGAVGRGVQWAKSSMNDEHNRLVVKLLFVACVVLVLLLTYVLGLLIFTNPRVLENKPSDVVADSDAYFKDCKILRQSCSDKVGCNLFSFCGSGSYKVCKIYDCGNAYGVFTQDYEGNIDTKREAKYDKKAVQAKKDACRGSTQVLEQKCVNKKMQLKVKISSEGRCKIGGFTIVYEGSGIQPNTFASLDDNTYSVTADTCGKITHVIPQTEEGISIF
jgi:hypothetical protein